MKKTFVRIAAAISTAVLCAVPTATSFAAQMTINGDANNDGTVDMADAVIITQWDTTKRGLHIKRAKADVNKDGRINAFDAKLIQRALLHPNDAAYNLDKVAGTFGDADGNGKVTYDDADVMQDILWDGSGYVTLNGRRTYVTPSYINSNVNLRARFDVDGSGKFDWSDATTMWCYNHYHYFFDRNFTDIYVEGDSNKDGIVNMADAVNIIQWLAGKNNQISQENSDVNEDGIITEADATWIQEKLLHLR